MEQITVAICTRDGAGRLPEVLLALGEQRNIAPQSWEILLIDNGSIDATADLFKEFAAQYPHLACRYIYEGEPGTGVARRRALREASGEWVCFVDDDNILDGEYLANARVFSIDRPKLGAFGGRSVARTSGPLPAWFDTLKSGLAVWDGGEATRLLDLAERSFTAGLLVRTAAVRDLLDEKWALKGRTATDKVAGEDLELCLKLRRHGWEIWYVPDLMFTHVLPEGRLALPYVKGLFATFGAIHLSLYPLYFPVRDSAWLRFALITASAIVKAPFFGVRQYIAPGSQRWDMAARAWTYRGALKYWRAGFETVRRTRDCN
jgi:glycosyltransferase involved in cell wall biosynthesis